MLTRRAPTNILVCTIALWVIAGFLPGLTAEAAAAGPAYHQEESSSAAGPTIGREVAMSVDGDPDEYAHTDDKAKPGDGTKSQAGLPFINVLIELISAWCSVLWGYSPL